MPKHAPGKSQDPGIEHAQLGIPHFAGSTTVKVPIQRNQPSHDFSTLTIEVISC